MKNNFKVFFNDYLQQLVSSIKLSDYNQIEKASSRILETIKKKGTVFICGNGGSAAIANHYVCDYLKYLRQHTSLKPKVISLSSNLETITAISNDLKYDQIFKYQAENLIKKNDILIVISSSGNSKNIKEVVKYCKKKNIKVIGFSGFNGGFLKKTSDISIHIPALNYGISEDSHHIIMHVILQFLISKNKR